MKNLGLDLEVKLKRYRLLGKTNKTKGFSLIELIIVVVIAMILLATISVGTSGAILNMSIEATTADLALAVYQAREQASTGTVDVGKRTFDLTQAFSVRPHNGITVSSTPVAVGGNCINSCNADVEGKQDRINSICVSENPFCFSPENSFTFERFSGRLNSAHAIFISSNTRKLTILITESGDYYIAELINGTWQSQRDLQNLFPKPKKAKETY